MSYHQILIGLALLFVLLERLAPRVPDQAVLRSGWLADFVYLIVNSKFAGLLIGYVSLLWVGSLDGWFAGGWLTGSPRWAQFLALFVITDLIRWAVHNLLHRIPWLWEFHKVHHSIVVMDWIGNWRFHWAEIAVYNSVLYIPAALMGADGEVALAAGVVDTLAGHFAHANVRWRVGWLKYLINCPEMHVWHHAHPDAGPVNRNFALTLTLWDWIFRTAWAPDHDPARLGFEAVEQYPASLAGQWAAPFQTLWRKFTSSSPH